ncbi:unnamed protein product [marine sediment metagenome]|uniref:M23ase beta-sheet core domain-containing protein n=1 Tax=marine sediment metagenome TaxID=412755 RepID=X1GXM5_9ZZZZ
MAIRYKTSGITLVAHQQFSPEKNHYKHLNATSRFQNDTYYHIALPIIGDWRISQGHSGNITHKDAWKYALDFDVTDEDGKTYKNPGVDVKDYYCYDLPVAAPADGYIVEILDGIEDNKINEVNMKDNWGNTVVIKHGEGFYSKMSHIRNDSFTVEVGDHVSKGHIVGYCGSSGRSPEPHLHFQLQATPYVGSQTITYPISYYLTKLNNQYFFHAFEIPEEEDIVSNVQTTKTLTDAFAFIPGKTMNFLFEKKKYKWEVFADSLNNSYIYCHQTKSSAYFVNNGTMFYFTDFYGDNGSLLHHFYYGAQKVLLGYYKEIELEDEIMIDGFFNKIITSLHDFTAPFFHYCKVKYAFAFVKCDDIHKPTEVTFSTSCKATIGSKKYKEIHYTFNIKEGKIDSFVINNDKEAVCV